MRSPQYCKLAMKCKSAFPTTFKFGKRSMDAWEPEASRRLCSPRPLGPVQVYPVESCTKPYMSQGRAQAVSKGEGGKRRVFLDNSRSWVTHRALYYGDSELPQLEHLSLFAKGASNKMKSKVVAYSTVGVLHVGSILSGNLLLA